MALVVTVPTWLAAGQLSAWSWASVHRGVAVGSPTKPGGRATVRFLTSSVGVVNPMWTLTSLFAPAFGLAGAADRPWKPKAALAAGASAKHAMVATANDIHTRRTRATVRPPIQLCPDLLDYIDV